MLDHHHANVTGTVKVRMGDGPMFELPNGPVEVTLAPNDVTLSWAQDDTRQAAAVPLVEFQRLLREKAIVMQTH